MRLDSVGKMLSRWLFAAFNTLSRCVGMIARPARNPDWTAARSSSKALLSYEIVREPLRFDRMPLLIAEKDVLRRWLFRDFLEPFRSSEAQSP